MALPAAMREVRTCVSRLRIRAVENARFALASRHFEVGAASSFNLHSIDPVGVIRP
jgi:hypothetical protein